MIKPMKTIVHPTDFSPSADRALAQVQKLAQMLGTEVHLIHKVVYPAPRPPTELLSRLEDASEFERIVQESFEGPLREAQRGLDERLERLHASGVSAKAHLEQSTEVVTAIEELVEAIGAELIVMGTHGRTGGKRWLIGSVAEKVLRHVPCDVLTLHDDSPIAPADDGRAGFGELLVTMDFSDGSRRAVDRAFELAGALNATVCGVHVLEFRSFPLEVEGPGERLRQRCEEALRNELGERSASIVVAQGDVVSAIQKTSEVRGSSWVVMGTHGRTGLSHALIGSVAERTARLCRLPVMTVRPKERP
jgi:nucleotide-binding universal stress UspA family protein